MASQQTALNSGMKENGKSADLHLDLDSTENERMEESAHSLMTLEMDVDTFKVSQDHDHGAFSVPSKRQTQSDGLQPPRIQLLALATSGLQRMYNLIKRQSCSPNKEIISHTSKNGHFIVKNGFILGKRYKVISPVMASAQSAVLINCQDLYRQKIDVVIKVMHVSYYAVGLKEIQTLRRLNSAIDSYSCSHTIHLLTNWFRNKVSRSWPKGAFRFNNHICLVFPAYNPSPLTHAFRKRELSRSQKLSQIRRIALRLLSALAFLNQQRTIHADLKPQNILLNKDEDIDSIVVVDFGNAVLHVHREITLYYSDFELQTLSYRAPEIFIGIPFSVEIDMWSLGCILAELLIARPLFAGTDRHTVLKEMTALLGPLPRDMCRQGKFYEDMDFAQETDLICRFHSTTMRLMKKIPELKDYNFTSFLSGLLTFDPNKRLTPLQALQHPFMASEFCIGHFLPDFLPRSGVISREDYEFQQVISPHVKRMCPSTYDILKTGTAGANVKMMVNNVGLRENEHLMNKKLEDDKEFHDNKQMSKLSCWPVINRDKQSFNMPCLNETLSFKQSSNLTYSTDMKSEKFSSELLCSPKSHIANAEVNLAYPPELLGEEFTMNFLCSPDTRKENRRSKLIHSHERQRGKWRSKSLCSHEHHRDKSPGRLLCSQKHQRGKLRWKSLTSIKVGREKCKSKLLCSHEPSREICQPKSFSSLENVTKIQRKQSDNLQGEKIFLDLQGAYCDENTRNQTVNIEIDTNPKNDCGMRSATTDRSFNSFLVKEIGSVVNEKPTSSVSDKSSPLNAMHNSIPILVGGTDQTNIMLDRNLYNEKTEACLELASTSTKIDTDVCNTANEGVLADFVFLKYKTEMEKTVKAKEHFSIKDTKIMYGISEREHQIIKTESREQKNPRNDKQEDIHNRLKQNDTEELKKIKLKTCVVKQNGIDTDLANSGLVSTNKGTSERTKNIKETPKRKIVDSNCHRNKRRCSLNVTYGEKIGYMYKDCQSGGEKTHFSGKQRAKKKRKKGDSSLQSNVETILKSRKKRKPTALASSKKLLNLNERKTNVKIECCHLAKEIVKCIEETGKYANDLLLADSTRGNVTRHPNPSKVTYCTQRRPFSAPEGLFRQQELDSHVSQSVKMSHVTGRSIKMSSACGKISDENFLSQKINEASGQGQAIPSDGSRHVIDRNSNFLDEKCSPKVRARRPLWRSKENTNTLQQSGTISNNPDDVESHSKSDVNESLKLKRPLKLMVSSLAKYSNVLDPYEFIVTPRTEKKKQFKHRLMPQKNTKRTRKSLHTLQVSNQGSLSLHDLVEKKTEQFFVEKKIEACQQIDDSDRNFGHDQNHCQAQTEMAISKTLTENKNGLEKMPVKSSSSSSSSTSKPFIWESSPVRDVKEDILAEDDIRCSLSMLSEDEMKMIKEGGELREMSAQCKVYSCSHKASAVEYEEDILLL